MHLQYVWYRCKRLILAGASFLGFYLFIYSPALSNKQVHQPERYWETEYGAGPTFDAIEGHELAWELPVLSQGGGAPKGVFFFAHGCNHACGDLWPPSPACPTCLGLPEEMRIRHTILKRGYAVVGMSSMERIKGCWTEVRKDEGQGIAKLLGQVLVDLKLDHLPLYTFGASSGGQLALMLPKYIKVTGVCAEVRGVPPHALGLDGGGKDNLKYTYPPTIFIHMPRHEENRLVIESDIAALKEHDIPVAEILIHPRPVTAEFLAERSQHISIDMGKAIVKALSNNGFLDKDGYWYEYPRPILDKWAPYVQPLVGDLTLALDKSQVTELLNLAWAKHEIVSDGVDSAITWLEYNGAKDIQLIL